MKTLYIVENSYISFRYYIFVKYVANVRSPTNAMPLTKWDERQDYCNFTNEGPCMPFQKLTKTAHYP